MTRPQVEVCDVAYAYPDGHAALQGVSFTIQPGASVALIGGNGAGKSTLLLHLNGVLLPQRGEVRIDDVPVTRASLATIRQRVGLIFQDADDQLFMPTVFDDVAFGLAREKLSADMLEARVMQALDTVGAGHLRERPPYRLSGGEKRAVAIAGILAMQPSLLVMDEPNSNLDPAARRRLIRLLAGLGHTQIIATHDLDLVLDLCSRVLILHQGRIVADGRPDTLFADVALLARCHLEPPLSQQRR